MLPSHVVVSWKEVVATVILVINGELVSYLGALIQTSGTERVYDYYYPLLTAFIM